MSLVGHAEEGNGIPRKSHGPKWCIGVITARSFSAAKTSPMRGLAVRGGDLQAALVFLGGGLDDGARAILDVELAPQPRGNDNLALGREADGIGL